METKELITEEQCENAKAIIELYKKQQQERAYNDYVKTFRENQTRLDLIDLALLTIDVDFGINKLSRKREIVLARQVCYNWLRQNTKLSLEKIGEKIGGYDHATVLHNLRAYGYAKELKDYQLNEIEQAILPYFKGLEK